MTHFSTAMIQWCLHRQRMVDLGLVAGSTAANQGQIASTLVTHLGPIALKELRKSHVEIFIGERKKTCAPITIQGELNVLRQFLNWCVDEMLLGKMPRLPTVKVANVEQPLPSDAAFTWVLNRLGPRMSQALEFMLLTGLAPHELERVQVRDLDTMSMNEKQVRLGIGQRDDFAVKQESRRRWVPLNQKAESIWIIWSSGLPIDANPFPTVDAMQKSIWRLRRAHPSAPAGVNEITPKTMRKWFASKVSGDQPEHVLQRLLGHAPGSPITRKHYVRSSDEQQSAAVEGVRLS